MVKVDLRFIGPDEEKYTRMVLTNPSIPQLENASNKLYELFEESFGRIHPHEDMLLDGFKLIKKTKNKVYLTVRWGR